jgi:hypothetical protein
MLNFILESDKYTHSKADKIELTPFFFNFRPDLLSQLARSN